MKQSTKDYLNKWYLKAEKRQIKNGVRFNLSFEEFLTLYGPRRIASIEKWLDEGSISNKIQSKNPFGYVLSWVDGKVRRETMEMNINTAAVMTRMKSKYVCRLVKGEKHTQESIEKIRIKLKGVPKTEKHRKNISKGAKGKSKKPWTEERKAARRELLLKKKAP